LRSRLSSLFLSLFSIKTLSIGGGGALQKIKKKMQKRDDAAGVLGGDTLDVDTMVYIFRQANLGPAVRRGRALRRIPRDARRRIGRRVLSLGGAGAGAATDGRLAARRRRHV